MKGDLSVTDLPDFVWDWIEEEKKKCPDLIFMLWSKDIARNDALWDWLFADDAQEGAKNRELFVRAWLDGRVDAEKKRQL